MKKQHIFFDFDGLKFDTTPAHVAYINETYGITSVASDYFNNPPLNEIIGKYTGKTHDFDEVYLDVGTNFHTSIKWQGDVPPMEGMRETIQALAQKYTLWTVTARQKSGHDLVRYLLDKHIPGCITGIHCVWEYDTEQRKYFSTDKRTFIESIEGEKIAFFDDSPDEILKIGNILPCYLYDPKRVHDAREGISNRIRSWEAFGKIFL